MKADIVPWDIIRSSASKMSPPVSMPSFLENRRIVRIAAGALVCLAAGVTASAQQNVGELFASDASVKGAVVLANSGTKVMSGSSIFPGAQTATLKLERGGSMMICPNTSLAVTTSQNGRQLMFSMNTGNLEMDYSIGAASDNLLTPDFRLLMPGPGRLHLAVRVNAKGDTCVQWLASNSSAVVVSEGMGDASYQVKPNEAVIFNGGGRGGAVAPPGGGEGGGTQGSPAGAANPHGRRCALHLSRQRSGGPHRERRSPQDGEHAHGSRPDGSLATLGDDEEHQDGEDADRGQQRKVSATETGIFCKDWRVLRGDVSLKTTRHARASSPRFGGKLSLSHARTATFAFLPLGAVGWRCVLPISSGGVCVGVLHRARPAESLLLWLRRQDGCRGPRGCHPFAQGIGRAASQVW